MKLHSDSLYSFQHSNIKLNSQVTTKKEKETLKTAKRRERGKRREAEQEAVEKEVKRVQRMAPQ